MATSLNPPKGWERALPPTDSLSLFSRPLPRLLRRKIPLLEPRVPEKIKSVHSLAELHAQLTKSDPAKPNGSATEPKPEPVKPVSNPPPPVEGAGTPAKDVAPAPTPASTPKTDTVAPDPLPFKIIRAKDSTVPKPCLANVAAFLREHSCWVGVLTYDEFADRIVVKRNPPSWEHSKDKPWTDADDVYTACWFQSNRMMISSQLAAEAVNAVARENNYHPVRDYLQRLKWDGKSRIAEWLIKYMGTEDLLVNREFGKMWLLSAVARIHQPGCQVDYTLQLEGEQGIRKSTGLRILAGDEWFTDHISDFRDKDARIELQGKWIVELSELHNLKGKSLEMIKSFLSTRVDYFRSPYSRRADAHPRQCVFAGSTNSYESLNDESGNRRFWPVRCASIDVEGLKRDRDQLWAETYARYKQGEKWWPDGNRELNQAIVEAQEQRYESGADDDLIAAWIEELPEVDDPADFFLEGSDALILSRRTKIRIREVMQFVLHVSPESRNAGPAEAQVRRWLKHNKWERSRRREGNYWEPPKTSQKAGPFHQNGPK